MPGAILLLIFAMLSIQTGAGFAKSLFPLAGAAGATAIRLFFASLILTVVWRPWKHRFSRSSLKILFVYGACLGLMNLAFYFSLERIPLGIAVSLEFIGPLALSLSMSRKALDFLWALLAALGIWFVLPHDEFGASLDWTGVLCALAAGVAWAFYIFFGRKAGKDLHGGGAATVGMFVATIVAAPVGIWLDADRILTAAHAARLIPLGIVVAALSSALPYSIEMIAMKKIPPKTFGILMSLEPAVASLVGFILLKEKPLVTQWMAIFFIVVASTGSVMTSRKVTRPGH